MVTERVYVKTLSDIADTKMTRADFLKFVGVALISVIGVSNFINSLLSQTREHRSPREISGRPGFGSGKFGA